MTATKVSITKEGSAEDLVNEALNLLDLRSRLPSNAKVFVKPNLVRVPREANISYEDGAWEKTFVPEGDIVHREVIAALLGALVDMGVKDVTVGEAPGDAALTQSTRLSISTAWPMNTAPSSLT